MRLKPSRGPGTSTEQVFPACSLAKMPLLKDLTGSSGTFVLKATLECLEREEKKQGS